MNGLKLWKYPPFKWFGRIRLRMKTRMHRALHTSQVMTWAKLIVLCLAAITVFSVANNAIVKQTAELRARETSLTAEKSGLISKASDKTAERNRVGTPAYIEAEARQEYQFVKPGELRFNFSDPSILEKESEEEKAIRRTLNAY